MNKWGTRRRALNETISGEQVLKYSACAEALALLESHNTTWEESESIVNMV